MEEKIPVYFINGFLESGKTEFIQFTIGQPYFAIEGTTLLLLCEEGMVEYDEDLLTDTKTVVEVIEEESDFQPEYLEKLGEKYQPERVIVEFNGMWMMKDIKLPDSWEMEQQITHVNAKTFDVYYKNMRSLYGEMVRNSDMVIFNRCDLIEDLTTLKRTVLAVNPKAEVVFEDMNGEVEEFTEADLPFDIEAPVIRLEDDTYGLWFLDALDAPHRYENKIVRFKGKVLKPEGMPKNCMVPGRLAMTCCEQDMSFLGFVCKSKDAVKFQEGDWVEVTAKIAYEYWQDYEDDGPVLYASEIKETKAPEQEIISLI